MFHNFSSRALRVVFLARKDAGMRGAAAMDVADLLGAIVREDQGEVAKLMPGVVRIEGQEELRPARPFFSTDAATAILASVEQLLAPEAKSVPDSLDMPVSPALQHTFNAAVDLVNELHKDQVEPLHLLAAMLVAESTSATEILKQVGITREAVRAAIQT